MEPGPLGWEMDPGMSFMRVREVGRKMLRPIPGGSAKAPSPHLSWGPGVLWPPTLQSRATCGPREKQQGAEGPGRARPQPQELRGFWGPQVGVCLHGGRLVLCTPVCFLNLGVSLLCLLPGFGGPTAQEERSSASHVIGDSRFMKRVSLRTIRGSCGRESRAASINPGLSGARTGARAPRKMRVLQLNSRRRRAGRPLSAPH